MYDGVAVSAEKLSYFGRKIHWCQFKLCVRSCVQTVMQTLVSCFFSEAGKSSPTLRPQMFVCGSMKPEMPLNRHRHRYALVFLRQFQVHATGKRTARKWGELTLLFLASPRCVLVCFQPFLFERSCQRAKLSAEVRILQERLHAVRQLSGRWPQRSGPLVLKSQPWQTCPSCFLGSPVVSGQIRTSSLCSSSILLFIIVFIYSA